MSSAEQAGGSTPPAISSSRAASATPPKGSPTPGPWGCTSTSNHAHDYRLTRPDGSPLPVTAPANDHSEQRANAHLIAAAPAMLAALEAVVTGGPPAGEPGHVDLADAIRVARAALALARGEAAQS